MKNKDQIIKKVKIKEAKTKEARKEEKIKKAEVVEASAIPQIKISVRNLVEFILRSGDIDNRISSLGEKNAMQEGTKMHKKIQNKMGIEYHAEVPLKFCVRQEKYEMVIEGRADGIIYKRELYTEEEFKNSFFFGEEKFLEIQSDKENRSIEKSDSQTDKENNQKEAKLNSQTDKENNGNEVKLNSQNEEQSTRSDGKLNLQSEEKIHGEGENKRKIVDYTIDEIKTMYMDFSNLKEPFYIHKAQAMCYAYIFATQKKIESIGVQLTYCNLDTEEIKRFKEAFTYEALESWFFMLIDSYKRWADFSFEWKKIRQNSIQDLSFPYEYRKGQKKLITDVYKTILRKKNLFIQAPTGSGKTLASVYPAVRAVGENLGDKIFYFTAKTITATVALESFELLAQKGYQAKTIAITAKEKLCMCEEPDCNPQACECAKGHYDRINDAVYELLTKNNTFSREILLEHAKEHMVCPFELCLDTSLWVDNIVCDYNYLFDPNVYLKRFFSDGIKGDYLFLVDEAHNLVERARSMYSETLFKDEILLVKNIVKKYSNKLEKELNRANRIMLDYKRECETFMLLDDVDILLFSLMRIGAEMDKMFLKIREFQGKEECLDFYFRIRNFLNIYEFLDEKYIIYCDFDETDVFFVKLFCVDPSNNLERCLKKGNSTIFFSATLLPIQYYKKMLSINPDNYAVYADTIFSEKQRLLMVGKDVSSKYTRRNQFEFQKMAMYIKHVILAKKGNYMVFFPSYKMLQQVYDTFLNMELIGIDSMVQSTHMQEKQREEFLEEFQKDRTNSFVAFCVMGGIFSEGIDLTKDALIGTIIVGTGLPQISNEREIIKNYFNEKQVNGFDYSYRYPGMNKVQQAAGRVIRTKEDCGIILLLDDRFLEFDNLKLFPREWEDYKMCNLDSVSSYLNKFWIEQEEKEHTI